MSLISATCDYVRAVVRDANYYRTLHEEICNTGTSMTDDIGHTHGGGATHQALHTDDEHHHHARRDT